MSVWPNKDSSSPNNPKGAGSPAHIKSFPITGVGVGSGVAVGGMGLGVGASVAVLDAVGLLVGAEVGGAGVTVAPPDDTAPSGEQLASSQAMSSTRVIRWGE